MRGRRLGDYYQSRWKPNHERDCLALSRGSVSIDCGDKGGSPPGLQVVGQKSQGSPSPDPG